MSLSSRESKLSQYREALLHLNTQFFLVISERRELSLRIQELKERSGQYTHFDPEREIEIFNQLKDQFQNTSIKELLGFSIIMEDQAMAMAPGTYPAWSSGVHLIDPAQESYKMINPLLLKVTHLEFFNRLNFNADFSFLKQL